MYVENRAAALKRRARARVHVITSHDGIAKFAASALSASAARRTALRGHTRCAHH